MHMTKELDASVHLLIPRSDGVVKENDILFVDLHLMIISVDEDLVLFVLFIRLTFNQVPQVSVAMVAKDEVFLAIQSSDDRPDMIHLRGASKGEVS